MQHDLNITRPESHVSIPPSLEINLVLTFYSATRLFLIVPCHSITTALYALKSLSVPMELSGALASIPLLKITINNSTTHILCLMGAH